MSGQDDLTAVARTILDVNLYMTLGTADEDGRPWVSPVYYATADYTDFYWISMPEARHSRNIARRPQVSMVVFDLGPAVHGPGRFHVRSGGEGGGWRPQDRAWRSIPVRPGAGPAPVTAEQVSRPAAYRLYRATVSEHFVICPRDAGLPCALHGIPGRPSDHRDSVIGSMRRGEVADRASRWPPGAGSACLLRHRPTTHARAAMTASLRTSGPPCPSCTAQGRWLCEDAI